MGEILELSPQEIREFKAQFGISIGSMKKFNPLWDLMIRPKNDNRYDPRQFHIGMFNYWTGEVCTEHKHKLKRS